MQMQLFYDKQQSEKLKQKELLESYKNNLEIRKDYKQLSADIHELKEKKKIIEMEVKEKLGLDQFEDLKLEIKALGESLTFEAIEALKKGEEVKVKDMWGNEYLAVWNVRFKKQNKDLRYNKENKKFI